MFFFEHICEVLLEAAKKEPEYDEIIDWLIEHYSDQRKMLKPRIEKLLKIKSKYDFLEPPKVRYIYRGLFNVDEKTLEKLKDQKKSDPVFDKSWSTSKDVAWNFAKGKYTKDKIENDKYSVVLTGKPEQKKVLLNWKKTSDIADISNFYNKIWKERLYKSIVDEKEIIVFGKIDIANVDWKKN